MRMGLRTRTLREATMYFGDAARSKEQNFPTDNALSKKSRGQHGGVHMRQKKKGPWARLSIGLNKVPSSGLVFSLSLPGSGPTSYVLTISLSRTERHSFCVHLQGNTFSKYFYLLEVSECFIFRWLHFSLCDGRVISLLPLVRRVLSVFHLTCSPFSAVAHS